MFNHSVKIVVLAIFQPLYLPERLRHHPLELSMYVAHKRCMRMQRFLDECGVALRHVLLVNQAPARLVLPAAEIPFVIHERPIVCGLQRTAILVHVDERPLAGLRILRIPPGHLLEQVLNQLLGNLGLLIALFALLRLALNLSAPLQHLRELLFRERLTGLAVHHFGAQLHLGQELCQLRLEITAVGDVIGRFVILLSLLLHLVFRQLAGSVSLGVSSALQRLQILLRVLRRRRILFVLIVQIDIIELVRRNLLVRDIG